MCGLIFVFNINFVFLMTILAGMQFFKVILSKYEFIET